MICALRGANAARTQNRQLGRAAAVCRIRWRMRVRVPSASFRLRRDNTEMPFALCHARKPPAAAAACASHPFAASRTCASAQTASYHGMVPVRSRRREDRERGTVALSAARSVCRASHMPWCASPTQTNVTARAYWPQSNHHLPKPSPSHATTPAPLRACVQWRGLPGPCDVKARAFLASKACHHLPPSQPKACQNGGGGACHPPHLQT